MKINRATKYDDLPDVMVPDEVASYLGINVDTVRADIRKGLIRATKQGRNYLIRKAWVLDFLDYQSNDAADKN